MTQAAALPANRFARIFKWLMLFCALVWVWGLALMMAWPWTKGGEWLPEFPLVATCVPDTLCVIPYGELAKARADGRLQAVLPPLESGETGHEQINLSWANSKGLIETTASAWNFQITVRYRIENDQPVMIQYREISIKLFFYALAGALFSTIGLYLRQLRH
jgi:hypothetical protein